MKSDHILYSMAWYREFKAVERLGQVRLDDGHEVSGQHRPLKMTGSTPKDSSKHLVDLRSGV